LQPTAGFTLIELLVTILLISILASIAIPLTLRWTNSARESEAKLYIGSINRAQQEHYTEKSEFARSLEKLDAGIAPDTNNYEYKIVFDDSRTTIVYAEPKKPTLRTFAGVVWVDTEHDAVKAKTCEGLFGAPVCLPEDNER
jgi:prepilin-type N-terminal cleavage/methylation domain-containing protein